jgi:hypothetical protein
MVGSARSGRLRRVRARALLAGRRRLRSRVHRVRKRALPKRERRYRLRALRCRALLWRHGRRQRRRLRALPRGPKERRGLRRVLLCVHCGALRRPAHICVQGVSRGQLERRRRLLLHAVFRWYVQQHLCCIHAICLPSMRCGDILSHSRCHHAGHLPALSARVLEQRGAGRRLCALSCGLLVRRGGPRLRIRVYALHAGIFRQRAGRHVAFQLLRMRRGILQPRARANAARLHSLPRGARKRGRGRGGRGFLCALLARLRRPKRGRHAVPSVHGGHCCGTGGRGGLRELSRGAVLCRGCGGVPILSRGDRFLGRQRRPRFRVRHVRRGFFCKCRGLPVVRAVPCGFLQQCAGCHVALQLLRVCCGVLQPYARANAAGLHRLPRGARQRGRGRGRRRRVRALLSRLRSSKCGRHAVHNLPYGDLL